MIFDIAVVERNHEGQLWDISHQHPSPHFGS